MRFSNIPVPILTALMLAYGCSTAEKANRAEPQIITSVPEARPTEKSFSSSPAHIVETRQSPATKKKNPPANVWPSLDSFIGLAPIEVRMLLGSPHFQRLDTPAQIWQYRRNGCVLYLFLYPSSDGLAVSHLETRNHVNSGNNRQKCFSEIVRAARKPPS